MKTTVATYFAVILGDRVFAVFFAGAFFEVVPGASEDGGTF